MSFERAQKVADAVLYEGYVLYPYRASAAKNRVRWQFGVVVPQDYAEGAAGGSGEPWAQQTECLIETTDGPIELDLRIRFLQVQDRMIEEAVEEAVDPQGTVFRPVESLIVDDRQLVAWEEGVERHLDATLALADLLAGEREIAVDVPGAREVEPVLAADGAVRGRIVRQCWPLAAVVRIAAERLEENLLKVRVRLENRGGWEGEEPPVERALALRRALVGAHTLLAVRGGAFVSLLDPPSEHAAAAAACANLHTWPVLVGPEGDRSTVLSSPIILYDHPAVAPESPGDLCDATEIDEILTLRVMTLTEDEKREARATDERARRIVERSDALPPEALDRLHGALRAVRESVGAAEAGESAVESGTTLAGWESFLNPPGLAPPEEATLEVRGVRLSKGSRVRLQPTRRADSMDMFLVGRTARIAGVFRDVEDVAWLGVVLEDDPAADLHAWHGRSMYFYPDEVEPLDDLDAATPMADSERRPHDESDPDRTGGDRGFAGDHRNSGPPPVPEDQPDVIPNQEGRLLVAGVGNIFLGDDGFGVEVVRRLAARSLPERVRVADYGIRGLHLAFELLEKGYDTTILVDALARGGVPGTVYLLEPDLDRLGEAGGPADAHGMDPVTVFRLLRSLGGTPKRVLIVGCEPADTEEQIGLSAPVAAAVDEAERLILELLERECGARGPRDQVGVVDGPRTGA